MYCSCPTHTSTSVRARQFCSGASSYRVSPQKYLVYISTGVSDDPLTATSWELSVVSIAVSISFDRVPVYSIYLMSTQGARLILNLRAASVEREKLSVKTLETMQFGNNPKRPARTQQDTKFVAGTVEMRTQMGTEMYEMSGDLGEGPSSSSDAEKVSRLVFQKYEDGRSDFLSHRVKASLRQT